MEQVCNPKDEMYRNDHIKLDFQMPVRMQEIIDLLDELYEKEN